MAAAVAALMLLSSSPLIGQESAPVSAGDAPPPAAQPPPVPQVRGDAPQPVAPAPPPGAVAPAARQGAVAVTPVRLSYTYGDVSFWRPGADNWTAAQVNIPLAPGDELYAPAGASLELQIGSRAFVRAAAETQVGVDNQEPDFLQLKLTSGQLALDLRSVKSGQTIEVDTPNAAFTIGAAGYYRVYVDGDTTTFITRRGGHATVTPAGGEPMSIAASEEVVLQGTGPVNVATYVAPDMDAWDRWNYARTDHLIDAVSTRYVSSNTYGVDELDHYGHWRQTSNYGSVWFPSNVGPGWAPYSDGRWIWDPYYGWTWVDAAPWGWAPSHYGRWVNTGGYWGWAPGPIVSAAVYAPAVVGFFGGANFGVSVGFGASAVGWVGLGWGEPLVPWWGGAGFAGVPTWNGWGGPRIVNNTVINRNTVINANTINTFGNAGIPNAVLAEREAQFGRGAGQRVRWQGADPQGLEPLRGKLNIQPVAASLSPKGGRGVQPPQALLNRQVTATRAARDVAAPLRAAGLQQTGKTAPPARLVSAPRAGQAAFTAPRAPFGQPAGNAERAAPPPPPQFSRQNQPAQRQFQSKGVSANNQLQAPPPTKPNMPRSLGPNGRGNAPAPQQSRVSSPAETRQQKINPPRLTRQAAPRGTSPYVSQRKQAAPRLESQSVSRRKQGAPRIESPSVSQRRAAPQPRMSKLPGTPSNQLFRGQPSRPAPQNMVRQNAPAQERAAAPQKHAAPQRLSQPRGGGHRVVQ